MRGEINDECEGERMREREIITGKKMEHFVYFIFKF